MLDMKQFKYYLILFTVILLSACNATKHVPDGQYLLNKVNIHTDVKDIPKDELEDYLRQTPNVKIFGTLGMQLGIYNIAGKDTSSKWNKSFMRMGAAPVIFDENLTAMSATQLQKLFVNKGYINARVDTVVARKNKKATVDYYIRSNAPYLLRRYNVRIKNPTLTEVATDTSRSLIRPGMLFDVDVLDAERTRVATVFRDKGYYNFNKEFLVYSADSSLNAHKVDVNLDLRGYLKLAKDSVNAQVFKQYKVGKVIFYANSETNLTTDLQSAQIDTTRFRDFLLISPAKKFITLDALVHNCYIDPHSLYNDANVEKTYSALNSLGPVKYVNISFREAANNVLDCYIIIVPSKTISLSTEVEGTYTDRYWGLGAKLGLVNKNAFKGAETLTMQGRLAYEWQDPIWAQELGAQIGLKFPRFIFPVGTYDFKRNIHANTEFNANLSYQFRPGEFTASNVGAGTSYLWNKTKYHHSFELFNLSYMNFDVDAGFKAKYFTTGLYNVHNYDSRFILRAGYSGSFSNFNPNRPLRDYTTYRYSFESAGNLLYGMSKLLKATPSSDDGTYKLFGIRYSQYIRGEYNSSYYQIIDKNNRFVYHAGIGVGLPYGNADVMPYERRFYSGGANSVRGWSESKLGPGAYVRNNVARDYNQVGDLKLDLNMEYRAKLFYVFEGALFLDAGNVWTIKAYDEQPLGQFDINTFVDQIAIAYGAGLRMDFSFFIARLDLGVKLYDPVPTRRALRWRTAPVWDDVAFHIAIGYPF